MGKVTLACVLLLACVVAEMSCLPVMRDSQPVHAVCNYRFYPEMQCVEGSHYNFNYCGCQKTVISHIVEVDSGNGRCMSRADRRNDQAYHLLHNGNMKRMLCDSGTVYSSGTCGCIEPPMAPESNVPDPIDDIDEPAKCLSHADSNDDRTFFVKLNGVQTKMFCVPGTAYSKTDCSCSITLVPIPIDDIDEPANSNPDSMPSASKSASRPASMPSASKSAYMPSASKSAYMPSASKSAPRHVSESARRPAFESAPRHVSESARRSATESTRRHAAESDLGTAFEFAPKTAFGRSPSPVSEHAPRLASGPVPRTDTDTDCWPALRTANTPEVLAVEQYPKKAASAAAIAAAFAAAASASAATAATASAVTTRTAASLLAVNMPTAPKGTLFNALVAAAGRSMCRNFPDPRVTFVFKNGKMKVSCPPGKLYIPAMCKCVPYPFFDDAGYPFHADQPIYTFMPNSPRYRTAQLCDPESSNPWDFFDEHAWN